MGMQQKRAQKTRKAIPRQKITKNKSNTRKTTVNLQKYAKENNQLQLVRFHNLFETNNMKRKKSAVA